MATNVTPVQLLRSEVLKKRPDPTKLLPGQGAVNTAPDEPGLFFADSTGVELIKIGPCSVGASAPNAGASGDPGQLGNTKGELWLDNSVAPAILKVWDGTSWQTCYTPPVTTPSLKTLGITPPFDGFSKTFTLVEQGTSVFYTPNPPENISVFIGGVSQEPNVSYTIAGNQITFGGDAPPSNATFHAFTSILT